MLLLLLPTPARRGAGDKRASIALGSLTLGAPDWRAWSCCSRSLVSSRIFFARQRDPPDLSSTLHSAGSPLRTPAEIPAAAEVVGRHSTRQPPRSPPHLPSADKLSTFRPTQVTARLSLHNPSSFLRNSRLRLSPQTLTNARTEKDKLALSFASHPSPTDIPRCRRR